MHRAGLHDVQYTDSRMAGRAYLHSDETGRYRFWGTDTCAIPDSVRRTRGKDVGGCGQVAPRTAHLHFMVTASEKRRLVTHIFVDGDPQLEVADSVFGVKDSLVREFEEQPVCTPTPDGRDLSDRAWTKVRFDIVLAPAET